MRGLLPGSKGGPFRPNGMIGSVEGVADDVTEQLGTRMGNSLSFRGNSDNHTHKKMNLLLQSIASL